MAFCLYCAVNVKPCIICLVPCALCLGWIIYPDQIRWPSDRQDALVVLFANLVFGSFKAMLVFT
jgi:hypothetical protein